jgi:dipeptidase E
VVGLAVFPHLDRKDDSRPPSIEEIEGWAAGLCVPACVIDDETDITVVDGDVEVTPEGRWMLLNEAR